MRALPTDLTGVVVLEPVVHRDARGWFMESFNQAAFEAALAGLGLPAPGPFVQDNQSCSVCGVLRGLHWQLPPHAQGKLVRVLAGRIWDVAVDLRRSAATFGRWTGLELSAANARQLWIPAGFAHGFLALEDATQVLYKTTAGYAPACERNLRWDDPALRIGWPLAVLPDGAAPLLAPKDAAAPYLADVDAFD